MSIKATINGTDYNNVTSLTATDGNTTRTATLTEVGTIETPTNAMGITANGTYDVTNYASAVVDVAPSGTALEIKTLVTVETEDTFGNILSKNPIPLSYENEMVFVFNVGDNLPTQGSYNWGAVLLNVMSTATPTKGLMAKWYANNITTTPSSMRTSGTVNSSNESYWTISDGHITAITVSGISGTYIPAGNSIKYLEIPIDFVNAVINDTAFF